MLLEGDAADAVAVLKRQPGKDLTVLGSGELVQSLRRRDLSTGTSPDPPLCWGRGGGCSRRRPAGPLRLVDSVTTTTAW